MTYRALDLSRRHDEAGGALCFPDPEMPSVCAICRAALGERCSRCGQEVDGNAAYCPSCEEAEYGDGEEKSENPERGS